MGFIGIVIVIVSVIGGYILEGGHMAILFQPVELLIIAGAGFGSLLISAPLSVLKSIMKQALESFKGGETSKEEFTELLLLLYELCKTAKANPMSIEAHVETPETSDIFKRYPRLLKDHHLIAFICDTLKVQVSSPMSPYDLEELMELDMAAGHAAESNGPNTISRLGDAMPALGIVAAVLGVVITMGKLTMGKEVIGHSIAAALIGTFLGILMSYGFFAPLSAKMESVINEAHKLLDVSKVAILAYAKNCSPKVCVEFARRTIPPQSRPTFADIDKATSSIGKAAA